MAHFRRQLGPAVGHGAPEIDAAARAVVLVAGFDVGRARRQAEAAVDAVHEKFIVDGHAARFPIPNHKETAGVEQSARIELRLHLAHQPSVAARPAPDRQRPLPLRRATRQDQVALRGFGRVLQSFQHLLNAPERQVARKMAVHNTRSGMGVKPYPFADSPPPGGRRTRPALDSRLALNDSRASGGSTASASACHSDRQAPPARASSPLHAGRQNLLHQLADLPVHRVGAVLVADHRDPRRFRQSHAGRVRDGASGFGVEYVQAPRPRPAVVQPFQQRLQPGRVATQRHQRAASGMGRTFNVACVMTPSVPRAPMCSLHRS